MPKKPGKGVFNPLAYRSMAKELVKGTSRSVIERNVAEQYGHAPTTVREHFRETFLNQSMDGGWSRERTYKAVRQRLNVLRKIKEQKEANYAQAGRKRGLQQKGKKRSASARAALSAAKKKQWSERSANERKALTAHLHSPEMDCSAALKKGWKNLSPEGRARRLAPMLDSKKLPALIRNPPEDVSKIRQALVFLRALQVKESHESTDIVFRRVQDGTADRSVAELASFLPEEIYGKNQFNYLITGSLEQVKSRYARDWPGLSALKILFESIQKLRNGHGLNSTQLKQLLSAK
ncbi:MAG: hypothetical protein HY917_01295 [Candidatus Diapherotrites archaeon]|nr:hypothetical protein [Candidatus Diapherotrites archaeon]